MYSTLASTVCAIGKGMLSKKYVESGQCAIVCSVSTLKQEARSSSSGGGDRECWT